MRETYLDDVVVVVAVVDGKTRILPKELRLHSFTWAASDISLHTALSNV